jgi:hypothetical protein
LGRCECPNDLRNDAVRVVVDRGDHLDQRLPQNPAFNLVVARGKTALSDEVRVEEADDHSRDFMKVPDDLNDPVTFLVMHEGRCTLLLHCKKLIIR